MFFKVEVRIILRWLSIRCTLFDSPFFTANEDDEKAKQAGADGERRGLKRQREEKEEHGRAYYEFREEAYNSR